MKNSQTFTTLEKEISSTDVENHKTNLVYSKVLPCRPKLLKLEFSESSVR